jgi:hypothetical protein
VCNALCTGRRATRDERSGEISRAVTRAGAQASVEISHARGAPTEIADISARSCSRALALPRIRTRTTDDPPSKLHRKAATPKVRRK